MRHSPLLPLARKYFETDPAEAARTIETLEPAEALTVLEALPPRIVAEAFRHFQVTIAARLIEAMPPSLLAAVASRLNPHESASFLRQLKPETRRSLVEHFPEKTKKEVQEILTYPEDSAGRMMTADFLAFPANLKAKDAIQKIRALVQKGLPASYVYVVDDRNHLLGVMNMRDMMLAPESATLGTLMRKDIFAVNCFEDREAVAAKLSERRYFAAPVVDGENRIVGVIRAEELISSAHQEATEDLQKMFGAGGDERAFSPVTFSIRKRLPWLHVNLATAFLAASVVALFEGMIAKMTVLAVFLPIVAGQGGNAGAQSLAIVMRGLVMREIPKERSWRLIWKEAWLGFVNGVAIGAVTGVLAWLWQGNWALGVVIGLAMIANLFFAGLAGAAIPIVMKAVGLDPAQCSNIILTTVTDVMGFFSFLGLAFLFQNALMGG